MFYLFEETEGVKRVIAEDASRSDLEDYATEYHGATPNHGSLYFAECVIVPVGFRATFDATHSAARKVDRQAAPPHSSGAGVSAEIESYLRRRPTVSFGPGEIAADLGVDIKRTRDALARMKTAGRVINPERGKYQFNQAAHATTNGAGPEA